jgi:outer membrane receptor for ferrienterochelin and colicins
MKSTNYKLLILLPSMAWCCINELNGQDSLQSRQLEEVVVTATRSERELESLPVPVKIIGQEQIKAMGSLRLSEVLAEQTGLAIVNDHGTGIQLQGFSPEYTMILIDGEPLIGRTSGVLELNRIAVGNIQQVEIMKGPSSSLYGSEALAGVINIITKSPKGINGTLISRYGTNNTHDAGANISWKGSKLGLYAFANRYHTDGYDLSPERIGNTVSPFTNYTYQSKITYDLSTRTRLSISGRYFTEKQESETDIGEAGSPLAINGTGRGDDWNINPVLTHNVHDKLKTTFRFYASHYSTRSTLTYQDNGTLYEKSFFEQQFYRPEAQLEYFFNPKSIVTLGIGRIWESVEATRYEDNMKYHTDYAYFQYEWKPVTRLNVLSGARWDDHSAYGSQISPKFSVSYDVLPRLTFNGSIGVGFKAPDFRQLYLNFTNSTVGYSVFGSQALAQGIERLQEQGQIDELLGDPADFGEIRAEHSTAYNVGLTARLLNRSSISLSLFRNDVKDLIDTKPVARKTNGQYVYSYYNVARVFTQGVETEISYRPSSDLMISMGYQLLIAKDKQVVEDVEAGKVYARDPETNATRRVEKEDYGGLFNRSRHMLNARIFYEKMPKGWSATARFIYRGRYGFADANNNGILDDEREYVNGYLTCNMSVAKTLKKMLTIQVGCDNLFNYTDSQYITSLPGRILWVSLSLTLAKNINANLKQ